MPGLVKDDECLPPELLRQHRLRLLHLQLASAEDKVVVSLSLGGLEEERSATDAATDRDGEGGAVRGHDLIRQIELLKEGGRRWEL